jgi:hypothetical protein
METPGSILDRTNKKGEYDKNKYLVEFWTYPEDLFTNAAKSYGGSWVMININVLTTSAQAKYGDFIELTDWERKRFSELDARAKTTGTSTPASTIASGATTGAAIGALQNFLRTKSATKAGSAAIQGGALAALSLTPLLSGSKRETKRIVQAIQLPMPNDFSTSYTMNWGEDSTKLFDMALRAPGLAMDVIKGAVTGDLSSLAKTGGQAKDDVTSLALSLNNAAFNGGVSAASGLASNPKKEMIFEGVGFRTFNMAYTFYPKSFTEYQKVQLIIHQLKFHMHPEYLSDARSTFIYPSEFDITFYTDDGEENRSVCRIATCALTNMTVNYTPQGMWVNNKYGYPTMISIQLAFKELSILTKDSIERGGF